MVYNLIHGIVGVGLMLSGWLRYGKDHAAPVRSDRILWVDPTDVVHKPVEKPETGALPPTLVVGGDWDTELEPIEHDIVHRAFSERFVDGRPWEETGYIEFLESRVSEHGDCSRTEAEARCHQLDELYHYISEHGYKSQRELEQDGSLINGLSNSTRPPAYREIAVNVTRDGEFVWHAGMHRLVIAQLLDVDEIPVRVNTRHERWQAIRDAAYNGTDVEQYNDHPDIEYLIQ